MSKTLILMRHGDYNGTALSAWGRAGADRVGQKMADQGLIPDVILHSTVPRALETAERLRDVFSRAAGRDIPLKAAPWLSLGQPARADRFRIIEDDAQTVLAVSHQPNIEDLSDQLGSYVSPHTSEATVYISDQADSWIDFSKPAVKTSFRP